MWLSVCMCVRLEGINLYALIFAISLSLGTCQAYSALPALTASALFPMAFSAILPFFARIAAARRALSTRRLSGSTNSLITASWTPAKQHAGEDHERQWWKS